MGVISLVVWTVPLDLESTVADQLCLVLFQWLLFKEISWNGLTGGLRESAFVYFVDPRTIKILNL